MQSFIHIKSKVPAIWAREKLEVTYKSYISGTVILKISTDRQTQNKCFSGEKLLIKKKTILLISTDILGKRKSKFALLPDSERNK